MVATQRSFQKRYALINEPVASIRFDRNPELKIGVDADVVLDRRHSGRMTNRTDYRALLLP